MQGRAARAAVTCWPGPPAEPDDGRVERGAPDVRCAAPHPLCLLCTASYHTREPPHMTRQSCRWPCCLSKGARARIKGASNVLIANCLQLNRTHGFREQRAARLTDHAALVVFAGDQQHASVQALDERRPRCVANIPHPTIPLAPLSCPILRRRCMLMQSHAASFGIPIAPADILAAECTCISHEQLCHDLHCGIDHQAECRAGQARL